MPVVGALNITPVEEFDTDTSGGLIVAERLYVKVPTGVDVFVITVPGSVGVPLFIVVLSTVDGAD